MDSGDEDDSQRPSSALRPGAVAAATLPATAGFLAIAWFAADEGGYFPRSWGWGALVFALSGLVALIARERILLGVAELVYAAAVTGFAGLIALSAWWSLSVPSSMTEAQRAIVYAAAVLAVLLCVPRRSLPSLLAGLLLGIGAVSAFALATRLFPDRYDPPSTLASYRLAEPLGYWNTLGALAAIGVLLALMFATRARTLPARAGAAALLPVLLPTLYFTFSRGGWVALAGGLAVVLALDPRRLQLLAALLVLAPAQGLAVLLASRTDSLTRLGVPPSEAAQDGRGLARIVLALALVAAAAAVGLALAERRLDVPAQVRRRFAGALAVVLVAALAVGLVRFGGPIEIVRDVKSGFESPAPKVRTDLNERLFNLSGSGRITQWEAAVDLAREHPRLGSGAGTFELYWLEHRTLPGKVRDAHSIYLETLAELGPLGLAVLALLLGVPLGVAVVRRREPLVAPLAGAYAVYVLHAGVDWDWEMPIITVAALASGAAILRLGGSEDRGRPLGSAGRAAVGGLLAIVAAFAFAGAIGNSALDASEDALAAGDLPRAASEAGRATRWAPWSAEPWQRLGDVQLERGNPKGARRNYAKAAAKDPNEWTTWYDLGVASQGAAQKRAYLRAAALNPLSLNIQILRLLGFDLPQGPTGPDR